MKTGNDNGGSKNNVYLTGFMGAGKTTVGRILAQRLCLSFLDLDDYIQLQSGRSIPDIFDQDGEDYFRSLEKEALLSVARIESTVVATGGGAVLAPENRQLMKDGGYVVYLAASSTTLQHRLGDPGPRPLLAEPSGLEALLARRLPLYQEADISVSTDAATHDQVADSIVKLLSASDLGSPKVGSSDSVAVDLEGAAGYPLRVGPRLLAGLSDLVCGGGLVGSADAGVFLVTDPLLMTLHCQPILEQLKAKGIRAGFYVIPTGEGAKTLAVLERIFSALTSFGATRETTLMTLGGGTVSDVGGMAAATYMRGMNLIHLPTTLLGQVDAAIGGKVAVNLPAGKNLVGTFYNPRAVIADTTVLQSLPGEEYANGLAEVVKYALLEGGELFEVLDNVRQRSALLAREPDTLARVVALSIGSKLGFVEGDLHDKGKRQFLNLGHTFAHALETTWAQRGLPLSHGAAVAVGLVMAARLAESIGTLKDPALPGTVTALNRAVGLPTAYAQLGSLGSTEDDLSLARELVSYAMLDKKRTHGGLTFVLPERVGAAAVVRDVGVEEVLNLLVDMLREAKSPLSPR